MEVELDSKTLKAVSKLIERYLDMRKQEYICKIAAELMPASSFQPTENSARASRRCASILYGEENDEG